MCPPPSASHKNLYMFGVVDSVPLLAIRASPRQFCKPTLYFDVLAKQKKVSFNSLVKKFLKNEKLLKMRSFVKQLFMNYM
jgi:hypothetical protein